MVSALLLSNSTAPGQPPLAHVRREIAALLAGRRRLIFVPYAQLDLDGYTARLRGALDGVCELVGAHEASDEQLLSADGFFVGGGNSFRLLRAVYATGLFALIRARLALPQLRPTVYIGASAGTNLACPTIRTTNDMPIVTPPSLDALGLVPFQINPHYVDTPLTPTHMGETRDDRLREFLEENDVPVVGLPEGTWLRVRDGSVALGGGAARVFRRGADPAGVADGSDLSWLLDRPTRYDSRT
jgi:dipeptidase E